MAYFLNGEHILGDQLSISWRDPFFDTGLGVFETLRTIEGRPMFFAQHLARLAGGAKSLQFSYSLPCQDDLEKQVATLVKDLPGAEGRIKICLLLVENGVNLLVTAEPASDFMPWTGPRAITLCPSPFGANCDLPTMKLWNRLPYALTRKRAEESGFDDAVFLSSEGHLTESTRSNLFFFKNDVLLTPKLEEGILPGVTRAVILELGKTAGMAVEEGEFTANDLKQADEAFLTGSFSGIQPVSRIESVPFVAVPGPKTLALIDQYERAARRSIC